MRKWIVTVLVVIGLAVAGYYARTWLPVVLPWLRNADNASALQSLTSILQITLWLGGAAVFVFTTSRNIPRML